VESVAFQRAIIGLIVANAFVLGLQTSAGIDTRTAEVLQVLDNTMLAIFVVELALRLYAHGWRFFLDPWSVFDFLVIGIAVVPAASGLSILRSFRVIRALRLVTVVPGMKRVVRGLLAAIPGMLSIVLLLVLVLYVGAVLATELYGRDVPGHFGNIGRSLFTLFQVMTGEAWPDIAREVLREHPTAWIFFVLYILTSTFVVLNLFTAVVVSVMEPEYRREVTFDATLLAEVSALRTEIADLRAQFAGPAVAGAGDGDELPTQRAGVGSARDQAAGPAPGAVEGTAQQA
jgi:voltage-gated sodium channel